MSWFARVLDGVVQEPAVDLPAGDEPSKYFPDSMPGSWVAAPDGTPQSGWTYANGVYTAPAVNISVDRKQLIALAAGIVLTSTGTPALDGTYSVLPDAQSKITSEALYIQTTAAQGGAKFSNGLTTRGWSDATGTSHTFPSTNSFISFAEAVAQYVDAVSAWDGTGSAPSNAATIA